MHGLHTAGVAFLMCPSPCAAQLHSWHHVQHSFTSGHACNLAPIPLAQHRAWTAQTPSWPPLYCSTRPQKLGRKQNLEEKKSSEPPATIAARTVRVGGGVAVAGQEPADLMLTSCMLQPAHGPPLGQA